MANENRKNTKQNPPESKRGRARELYFPGRDDETWDRAKYAGFASIPKTLAYIMELMKQGEKDPSLPRAYFALWCNTWDDNFVLDVSEEALALESGFAQKQLPRRRHEWRNRMRKLEELGFIAAHKSGDSYQQILLLNPNVAVVKLLTPPDGAWFGAYPLRDELRTALRRRGKDISAVDLDFPEGNPLTKEQST